MTLDLDEVRSHADSAVIGYMEAVDNEELCRRSLDKRVRRTRKPIAVEHILQASRQDLPELEPPLSTRTRGRGALIPLPLACSRLHDQRPIRRAYGDDHASRISRLTAILVEFRFNIPHRV